MWSDDSAIQLSDSPSTSGATASSGISLDDNENSEYVYYYGMVELID